jgi:hypothetical protein
MMLLRFTVLIFSLMESIDSLSINTIRTLCMDAVQQANSGHPGTPMAMAPVVYLLWQEYLRFDPEDPIWPDRDRFILSAGHASTLLYSVLHLARVKAVNRKYERLGELSVSLDDLKNFRQLKVNVLGIRNIAGPPELRRRPARSAKVLRRVSAWPSGANGSPRDTTGQSFGCSISMSTLWPVTGA